MIFDKVMLSNPKRINKHVNDNISKPNSLNHEKIIFKKAIRGFVTEYQNEDLTSYFWIHNNWVDYIRFDIESNKYLDLRLGNPICHVCMRETNELLKNMCYNCSDPKDPYLIRLACMFNKEYSFLNKNKSCSKTSPACNLKNNAKMCHSEHVIYIGRLNNLIKVGISRSNRRGSYKSRLSEQGLNEAIVIRGFKSIVAALEIESLISHTGYKDSMKFDEKINQLHKKRSEITLKEYFPFNLVSEKLLNYKIEHYNIYPDIIFEKRIKKGDSKHIVGIIHHIQGPILIIKKQNEFYYWNTKNLLNKEILNFKTKELI